MVNLLKIAKTILGILNQNHHQSSHFEQFNLTHLILTHFPIRFFYYLIIFKIFRMTVRSIMRLYIIDEETMAL